MAFLCLFVLNGGAVEASSDPDSAAQAEKDPGRDSNAAADDDEDDDCVVRKGHLFGGFTVAGIDWSTVNLRATGTTAVSIQSQEQVCFAPADNEKARNVSCLVNMFSDAWTWRVNLWMKT